MMFHKKGQALTMYKLIHWVYRITIVGIFMFMFFLVASRYISDLKIVPSSFDDVIYTQRFMSSIDCFAVYDDISQRTMPLHIDMKKFNDNVFKSCYPAKENERAYRLTIDDKTIKSSNWDGQASRRFVKQVYVDDIPKKLFIEVQNE